MAQKSIQNSKKKLQDKAKDIEESAAYSETFEEESLAKSSNLLNDALNKDPKMKMDTVKEESIDESI